VLQESIGWLLKRPLGQPSHEVCRYHVSFSYRAASWTKACRVVAKVAWHPGELYPRIRFIVTNLTRLAERVVAFYNHLGTVEQPIKEGKTAVTWTRLSCHRFAANAVRQRLHLHALACNLADFLRVDPGAAGAGQAVVAQDAAGQAGEDRRQDRPAADLRPDVGAEGQLPAQTAITSRVAGPLGRSWRDRSWRTRGAAITFPPERLERPCIWAMSDKFDWVDMCRGVIVFGRSENLVNKGSEHGKRRHVPGGGWASRTHDRSGQGDS
jgi:hypothetical protein